MSPKPNRFAPSLAWQMGVGAASVGIVALALYTLTLSPGMMGGDAGEMQLVPALLSLAHPTGYPLQTLIGKAWAEVIRVGSVAYRLNLLSAVGGGMAVSLLFLTV